MRRSRQASIEFSLEWHSSDALHRDSVFLQQTDLLRDRYPGNLKSLLGEAAEGETVSEQFATGELVAPWSESRVHCLPRKHFQSSINGHPVEPIVGRFFPRGLVSSARLSSPGDIRPMRITALESDHFTADFNHPLAAAALKLSARADCRYRGREQRGDSSRDIVEILTTKGPGMYAPLKDVPTDFYRVYPFHRLDESRDGVFYAMPRMLHHIDDASRQQLQQLYEHFTSPGVRVLDLMSSWVSHLSRHQELDVSAIGMNAEELEANPLLSDWQVRDLNTNTTLPYADGQFDLVVCSLSVEYLVDPVAVFEQVRRVLRPGGRFVCAFSERWFPTKAIQLWSELHPFERLGLVLDYFRQTGFTALQTKTVRGLQRPESDKYAEMLPYSDPLYAAWGGA